MGKTTKPSGKDQKAERIMPNAKDALHSAALTTPRNQVPSSPSLTAVERATETLLNALRGNKTASASESTLESIAGNELVKILRQHAAMVHGVKVKTFSPSLIHYIVSLHDPADLETKSGIYGKISELESMLHTRIKVQFTRAEHMEAYEGITLVL